MKLLIAYASRYGCTEKAAGKLAEYAAQGKDQAGLDIDLINLKEEKAAEIILSDYDTVAIGGSIYAGNILKEVKEFCSENTEDLIQKRLGLFICGGMVDKAEEQLNNSFDQKLLEQAATRGYFGYEFNLEKLNFLARMIVKKLAKVTENKSEIKENNIKEFARDLIQGRDLK